MRWWEKKQPDAATSSPQSSPSTSQHSAAKPEPQHAAQPPTTPLDAARKAHAAKEVSTQHAVHAEQQSTLHSWWHDQQQHAQRTWDNIQKRYKNMKPVGLPVRVDVEILKPLVTSTRAVAAEVYSELPEPVKPALPYFGTIAVTAAIAHAITSRMLAAERRAREELKLEYKQLQRERDVLRAKCDNLQARAGQPRADVELAMADAVAKATAAAAAAAEQATRAVEICVLRADDAVKAHSSRPPR